MQHLDWSNLILLNEKNVSANLTEGNAGVFRIAAKNEDNKNAVIFVGEALDLKKRLLQVLTKSEPNQSLKLTAQKSPVYFKYSLLANAGERKDAVHTIYQKYRPECNTTTPPGGKITMNFD